MDFLLTGTRVYGPAKHDSDLDIVVMYDEVYKIYNYLYKHNISLSRTPAQDSYGVDGGFYFDIAGIKVNIIVANSVPELEVWKERTERMKTISPISDRETRIATFNEEEGNLGAQLRYDT